MIEIGQYNILRAIRSTNFGMLLAKDGDQELILLPGKYLPRDLKINDEIKVFVYKDKDDVFVATTQEPKITLNQFACLQVKDMNDFAAFLDWGLDKDLMVHHSEQIRPMREGEYYLVYLYLDEKTDRLTATSDIDRFLENDELTVKVGDKVDLLIGHRSDLGVNVIINNRHKGLIYHNELFKTLYPGDRTTGYIKEIRNGNKIDVSLQQQGFKNIEPSADIIMKKLKRNNGFLPLNDDSSPEDITYQLEMSKKTFKKAIGILYKNRLILIKVLIIL